MKLSRRELTVGFVVGLIFLGIDALLKWIVSRYVESPIAIFQTIFGVDLWIQCVTNRGGAWGMLALFHTQLLYFRMAVVALLIAYGLFWPHTKLFKGALLLVIAGALGNILDCFIYGHVIDMIHFTFWGRSYGIFNIADALICFGAFTIFVELLKRPKPDPETRSSS